MNLDQLGLQIDAPMVHPGAGNFRPPTWPPPPDWAPILDAQGNPVCHYSDSTWPLDVWGNRALKINFGDGKTKKGSARLDPANANLLRQCTAWFMWGHRGCRTAGSLCAKVTNLKPLFVVCSEHGILASDLMRFEKVVDEVAANLAPSNFEDVITILHELLDANEQLGFCLLNQDGLARLAMLQPDYDSQQTPYIPPRIWTYQLNRLRECLQDYVQHQERIEDCFRFCLEAYSYNHGSLKAAVTSRADGVRSPFQNRKSRPAIRYHGSFKLTADRFGITELIGRWAGPFTDEKGEKQIVKLSQYLDLVCMAGLAYLLNFSLMRIQEGYSLRSDCLLIERDEKFGDIPMLVGETTKTDHDADARWPVSKSAPLAVDVMKHIAALRMLCARERDDLGITEEDKENPYLIFYNYEPWSPSKHKHYRLRPTTRLYQDILSSYPRLLDASQITINDEDLRVAKLITPTLDSEKFKVGVPWPFAWHQLRRTGAVNMQASDLVDDSSLQQLLKHHSRVMMLFYGRNHSRLALNEKTRILFIKTIYEELGRALRNLPSPQFVSPLGEDRKEIIVHLIKEADALTLDKAAKQGQVGARRIRAGFCVNHRPCPYGGIEAIAHCLGEDGGKGCPDLLINMKKEGSVQLYEKVVDDQLKVVHPESPRYQSLQAEKRAIGKFYAIVKAQKR